MSEAVPVTSDLASVYEDPKSALGRYNDISAAFVKSFGTKPDVIARAPGRVNLIGEHIDYSGYGVLPMAIQQDTIVAIKRGGTDLAVTSLYPDKYPDVKFSADPKQEVDVEHHSWANYFLCAYKGVDNLLESKHGHSLEPMGLQVLVHGVVPTGSGLSSSAAIICSSMLAILAAHNKLTGEGAAILKADVADFAAKAEAGVGVQCGGMDQAISMMGVHGVAKKVEFNPVRAEDVVLPSGATFVIANSLAVSDKAIGAHRRY
ncbi:hypothetical protein CEUSTIGMA_g13397.t1 [Chlamydomonas eustigma]|uniref:Galactokinase N-terminal domain-containing protein n=1 Tax=Chlamydomonas eustigma TaxID=1157962 RepID=A0A250XSB5_9CHLO|nr:hypothetical protein CEUSTIGMA_g13397.t1 [Chlamydomonas eustigma]|eukprot:GAX85981.1 hypothetical protein CEUSTIGMA_g13397.t1 [Chlamydomonas eustigma]